MSVVIPPSILNRGFGHLADEPAKISDADPAHMDTMDDHFVPNLTPGLPLAEAAAKPSPTPVSVHLMIEDLDR